MQRRFPGVPDYMIIIITVMVTITVITCCIVGLSEYSRFGWKHKPGILCRMALKWRFCHSKYYETWCNGLYVHDSTNTYHTEVHMTFDRFLKDYSQLPDSYNPRDIWVSVYFYIPGQYACDTNFAIIFDTEADCQRYINWKNYTTPRSNPTKPIESYEIAFHSCRKRE